MQSVRFFLHGKRLAFAGFIIDFIGAIFCFLMANLLVMPDINYGYNRNITLYWSVHSI